MKNGWTLVVSGLLALFVAGAIAAEKPSEQYSKAMKDIGAATQNLMKASQAEDFDTVEKNAATIGEAFSPIEKYWAGRAEDASKFAATAIKAAADLRVAAGLKSGEGVTYSAKELTDACMGCHTAHRERLPDGSFEIK